MPPTLTPEEVEAVWRNYMLTGSPTAGEFRFISPAGLHRLFRHLPASPRCRLCWAPFKGLGGTGVRLLFNRWPSRMNPQMCNACEDFAQHYQGGAEVPLTVLFADVRGSTSLAEGMSPRAFSDLINRFYTATTQVLYDAGAMVEKLIGDEVTALFAPGIAGPGHAAAAVRAARQILRQTGNTPGGQPWVPVGAGVHTGTAFVGAVGGEGSTVDITALGDDVNIGARLASLAKAGQVLVSDEAARAAELDTSQLEAQELQLKGRSEPVRAWVVQAGAG
jgi:adenylate cyclase